MTGLLPPRGNGRRLLVDVDVDDRRLNDKAYRTAVTRQVAELAWAELCAAAEKPRAVPDLPDDDVDDLPTHLDPGPLVDAIRRHCAPHGGLNVVLNQRQRRAVYAALERGKVTHRQADRLAIEVLGQPLLLIYGQDAA